MRKQAGSLGRTFLRPILTAVLLAGCGEPTAPPDPARSPVEKSTSSATAPLPPPTPAPEPLRVAAASDLREALPALAQRFTAETGVPIVPIFGASGQLAEQIKAGAPFDVFLAANRKFIQDLADAGFIDPRSPGPYARGILVLAVHREAGSKIAGLEDLKRPEVKKIALANPATAPYGAAGKQALERAGLWKELEPKIVQAESVRQALQFVETGNAEAGLVGKSSAVAADVRVLEVDPSLYDLIIQSLGIVAQSKHPYVQAFRGFVLGAEGQKILADFGFKPPPPFR